MGCLSKRGGSSKQGALLAAGVSFSFLHLVHFPSRSTARAALLQPWVGAAVPSCPETPGSAAEAARLGAERARQVVDPRLAAALYHDQRCFGLCLLRGTVSSSVVRCMRDEAVHLHQQGKLTPSGDPSEPQLSEQYKKYFGDKPTLRILDIGQAEEEGLHGLAYGSAFMCTICDELSACRPNSHRALEPGTLQLACYNGGGVAYHVHEDFVPKEDYEPERLPDHHRLSYKRRITAILYLQSDWQDEWGGAFRAHVARPSGEEPNPDEYVDVQPEGGALLLFRSDMPHEVLPTFRQRFALSMWCHAVGA